MTGGTDRVQSASLSLNLANYVNVENAALFGYLALNLTGTNATKTLSGSNANNTLAGLAGINVLLGNGGSDAPSGGLGSDTLRGGTTRDHITDFQHGVDDIDLHLFMAGGSFISPAAFSGVAKHLRYDEDAGVLIGDLNGDGIADFQISIDTKPALTVADFIF